MNTAVSSIGGTARPVIIVDVELAGTCTVIMCKAHRHEKHANTRGSGACPPENGSGGIPPGNFEKLYRLRLNLRAFLVIYHPVSAVISVHSSLVALKL